MTPGHVLFSEERPELAEGATTPCSLTRENDITIAP